MNWYIVQAYSGFEKKVVESIKDTLVKNKLDSHLSEILVPTHQVTEVKKGKRTKKDTMMGALMVFGLASIAAIFFLILDQILRFLLNLVLTINF